MIDFNKLKQVHEIANNVSKKEKYYYIDIEMQTLYLSDTPGCFCFNLEVCSGEGVFKYYELSLD